MAGRQIKLSKGANDLYVAGRGHVFAEKIQPLPENLKKKISIILEAIPSKSKSEIAEVLQACDYDVDKTLDSFMADSEIEPRNEWIVQGKRKNKKKKRPGKKAPAKDAKDSQTQDGVGNTATGPKTEKTTEEELEKKAQNLPNGTVPNGRLADKPMIINDDLPKSLEPLKPITNDDEKPADPTPSATSPLPSSPLLSPADSVSSSQDSQTFNKSRTGNSSNEKQPRTRTTSTSGPEVVKKSLKDLQRSSVSISRFQSMLDEHAEVSVKTLTKSFQAIRQALDEREKLLGEQLQSVIEESKKLLEERQVYAEVLKFKCDRVVSMSDEQTTELRNEIKHFVGERKIDDDLGKTMRFLRDEEKLIETVKNFGEVPPIKHYYTPYKRKNPEPVKPNPQKPAPVQTNTVSSSVTAITSNSTTSTKADSSIETRSSSSRNEKRTFSSPSQLKDQAEIHAKLQQVLKEQQVLPVSEDVSKPPERNAAEKPKLKEAGGKTSRASNGKGQQGNPRREQTFERQRQTNPANSTQNSTKSSINRNDNKTNGENSKTHAKSDGLKAQDASAENKSQAQDGSPADNGTQAQKDKPAEEVTSSEKTATAHDSSNHLNNPGNRRSRRRYIRKTPVNDGSPIFKTRTSAVDTVNDPTSAKENGNDDTESRELPSGNPLGNETNGFVPLPQRNRKTRKLYYKKDPNSQIQFPPPRENGSVLA